MTSDSVSTTPCKVLVGFVHNGETTVEPVRASISARPRPTCPQSAPMTGSPERVAALAAQRRGWRQRALAHTQGSQADGRHDEAHDE